MKIVFRPYRAIALLTALVALSSFAVSYHGEMHAITGDPSPGKFVVKDSIGSQKAFLAAYKVLMSPRCMNCHPKGDVPLQGDDSHLHTQGVQRGVDGKGVYALKCANCHQPSNLPGLHMPPGNPNWHLPPANMKMVFEGKTPRELAAQLKDVKRNGNKTLAQLIDHVSHDELVLAGWNPGEGRTLPPLSHEEFAKNFKAWIDKGAYLPAK
ncbi:MAG TPA: hypothetical protein VL307_17415 [Chitinophagaceae bacterium]|nr:hypothetical protein [Chitinophagaceae bacterium]